MLIMEEGRRRLTTVKAVVGVRSGRVKSSRLFLIGVCEAEELCLWL